MSAGKRIAPAEFKKRLEHALAMLKLPPAFAERYVNEGLSGGEKKKAEILQLALLAPRVAILDETDSGLDVDALKTVASGVKALCTPANAFLIITHYTRILDYLTPDTVYVLKAGKIVEQGGAALARRLEKEGFGKY